MPELVRGMSRATTLTEGTIRLVVYELRDTILMAHLMGDAVKFDGLGTFTPTIRMDGELDILFRPDPAMLRDLNDPSKFTATILNRANIGKSANELVAQWNAEHPEDPLEE
jgi:hypothetical protein